MSVGADVCWHVSSSGHRHPGAGWRIDAPSRAGGNAPSPQGDLRVVMRRTLVGRRTGPLTFRRLSLAPLIRSAHTFSRFFTLRLVSVMRMRCTLAATSSSSCLVFSAAAASMMSARARGRGQATATAQRELSTRARHFVPAHSAASSWCPSAKLCGRHGSQEPLLVARSGTRRPVVRRLEPPPPPCCCRIFSPLLVAADTCAGRGGRPWGGSARARRGHELRVSHVDAKKRIHEKNIHIPRRKRLECTHPQPLAGISDSGNRCAHRPPPAVASPPRPPRSCHVRREHHRGRHCAAVAALLCG